MGLEVGAIVEGKVTGITKFGAFVELPDGKTGMVHISEVAATYVKEIGEFLTVNQQVRVRIMAITPEGRINLSIKRAIEPTQAPAAPRLPVRPQEPSRSFSSASPQQRRTSAPPPRKRVDAGVDFSRPLSTPANLVDMLNQFKVSNDEDLPDVRYSPEFKRGNGSRKHSNNKYDE